MRKGRQLSERVQQKILKDPSSFRARMWWLCGWGSLIILVLVLLFAVTGQRHIYEAGPVSHVHRFIENDCAQCHETWSPIYRLVFFDDQISSVSEQKCQKCHLGLPHHPLSDSKATESSAHGSLGCATCHREHQGANSLIEYANQQCINCHREIEQHGGSTQFVQEIGSFGDPDAPDAHPAFALHRLLNSPTATPVSKSAKVLLIPGEDLSEAQSSQQLLPGDVSQIRFNHKKHLIAAEYDDTGNIIHGLQGPDGKLVDLSQNCSACHQPDAAFKRMQPVTYEKHCKDCHELSVGLDPPAGENESPGIGKIEIPHEDISSVVGFLTQKFTLKALDGKKVLELERLPGRLLPGVSYQPAIDEDTAQAIKSSLAQAKVEVDNSLHALIGREAQGGCRFCHTVQQEEKGDNAGPSDITSMKIVKPNMPQHWMPHAIFSHDSHQMMNCQDCHIHVQGKNRVPVRESEATSDVLMPTIEICQQCHSDRASAPVNLGHLNQIHSAGTQCTLCHSYHDRSMERGSGILMTGQNRDD